MGKWNEISLSQTQINLPDLFERKSSWCLLILIFGIAGVSFSFFPLYTSLLLGAVLLAVITIKNPVHGIVILLIGMQFLEKLTVVSLGPGIPNLSFSRFMILILMLSLALKWLTGELQSLRVGWVEFFIIGTVFGMALAAPKSVNPVGVLQTTVTMHLIPLLMYPFLKNLVRSKRDLHQVLLAIVVFGTLASIYAIFETVTGTILFFPGNIDLAFLRTTYTPFGDLQMLRGLMGGPGNFGRILIISIPVSVYLYYELEKPFSKSLQLASLFTQFCGLYLSLNRSSWLSLMVGLFLFQFFEKRFRRVFWILLLIGILLFTLFFSSITDSTIVEERLLRRIEDLGGRLDRWQTGFEMWRAKPLLGWGFGRFAQNSDVFRPDGSSRNIRAVENDYLLILVGSGLVGFLPYLLFLLIPLIYSLRLYRRSRSPDWNGFIQLEAFVLYWVVILGFLMTSMTAIHTKSVIKIFIFAIAGAIIGTHQHLLNADHQEKGQKSQKKDSSLEE